MFPKLVNVLGVLVGLIGQDGLLRAMPTSCSRTRQDSPRGKTMFDTERIHKAAQKRARRRVRNQALVTSC